MNPPGEIWLADLGLAAKARPVVTNGFEFSNAEINRLNEVGIA
ncbi:MAG TPA: hypothetical protein VK789_19775 [Bryobacteraceae bacterium]|nr:hypothetical protein [Bryobacteraceae bacterium]